MQVRKESIQCFLTDEMGKPLLESDRNAIRCRMHESDTGRLIVTVMGFVSCFQNKTLISAPIPFSISKCLSISRKEVRGFEYRILEFLCKASYCKSILEKPGIRLYFKLELLLLIHDMEANLPSEKIWNIKRQFLYKPRLLKGEVYHYAAVSDGRKRIYTNEDEMKSCGCDGILAPENVSYYSVYVNGMLLPETAYEVAKGCLVFLTDDVPMEKQMISIVFVTIRDKKGRLIHAKKVQYHTISDGKKSVYTNDDELTLYGHTGIMALEEVSLCHLYMNGVLQPESNYAIEKNRLELTTLDVATEGAIIILEFIVLKGEKGELLKGEEEWYHTFADTKEYYKEEDGLRSYSSGKILHPNAASFQNLFINSVIQHDRNYKIHKGYIHLKTDDLPVKDAPISLQSVKITQLEDYEPEHEILRETLLLLAIENLGRNR